MKSQEWKNVDLINLSENIQKIYFNFNFIVVFSKLRKSISNLPFTVSFVKFFVTQTSRTRFFFICYKVKYLCH